MSSTSAKVLNRPLIPALYTGVAAMTASAVASREIASRTGSAGKPETSERPRSAASGARSMKLTVAGMPAVRSASRLCWAIRAASRRVEDSSLTPALTTASVRS